MKKTFASLRFPNYRLWFVAGLVSNVGTWMQRVAQDWLVLTVLTADSGLAVGIVTGLQFAPFLLLSPLGGVLADRFDHRKILLLSTVAAGLLAAGLGTMVMLEVAELWHVYLFAFGTGIVSALDGPARQVFVSDLVPVDSLPNAVGLNSASFNAARLIGPASAGLLIHWVGIGWVFMINAGTFLVAIAALLMMNMKLLYPQEKLPRAKGQLAEGWHYLRSRRDLMVVLAVVGVVSTFGLNFQLTSALMARTEFGLGADSYGVLGSILAIGSLTGALIAARRKRPRVRLVMGAAFAFGLTSGLMALMPNYLTYAISCIPVGFFVLTMMTTANATIQITTPPAMRGRVMAIYMMIFLGATPLGSPLVGWIGEAYGARWAIGIGSITALLVTAGAAWWALSKWELEISYQRATKPYLIIHPTRPDEVSQTRELATIELEQQRLQDESTRR